MNKKVEKILESLSVIQNTYPEDTGLLLADDKEIIAYLPGRKIDLKIRVGSTLDSLAGSVTSTAFKSKKKEIDERGPERYGVAYIATASPIIDGGNVVGVLTSIISNQKLDTLRKATDELYSVMGELAATSEEMSKASDQTAQQIQFLSEESQAITNDIKGIHEILNFVKDIATQSHVLGLNAAIEAARSGQHGRGFAVVANEIRKMAENSKNSTNTINDQLQHMEQRIIKVNHSIQEISAVTEEHSAGMQEFHSSFEQLAATTEQLKKQASA